MLVSVVIPSYNYAALLREALNSVLAQTYKDIQVIVVDDGSTDDTSNVLNEFTGRVQAIRLGRSGISAARNCGIDVAHGEFIAFLDSDDLWSPEKIEKHLNFAMAHPETVVTYTDASQFSSEGVTKTSFVECFPDLRHPSNLFAPMITRYAIPTPSATMVKASFLKESGLRFREQVRYAEDLVFCHDVLLAGGKFGYLPEKLTMRRIHGSNMSGNHRRRFEQRKLIYTDMLAQSPDPYSREQKSALKYGLKDATYRVAECDWEDYSLSKARRGFFQTIGLDSRGMQALAYGMLTLLPPSLIANVRKLKQSA
ncbi:MAG: glycosyltransferase family 2 protein [Acidobacteriaceae bacterium]